MPILGNIRWNSHVDTPDIFLSAETIQQLVEEYNEPAQTYTGAIEKLGALCNSSEHTLVVDEQDISQKCVELYERMSSEEDMIYEIQAKIQNEGNQHRKDEAEELMQRLEEEKEKRKSDVYAEKDNFNAQAVPYQHKIIGPDGNIIGYKYAKGIRITATGDERLSAYDYPSHTLINAADCWTDVFNDLSEKVYRMVNEYNEFIETYYDDGKRLLEECNQLQIVNSNYFRNNMSPIPYAPIEDPAEEESDSRLDNALGEEKIDRRREQTSDPEETNYVMDADGTVYDANGKSIGNVNDDGYITLKNGHVIGANGNIYDETGKNVIGSVKTDGASLAANQDGQNAGTEQKDDSKTQTTSAPEETNYVMDADGTVYDANGKSIGNVNDDGYITLKNGHVIGANGNVYDETGKSVIGSVKTDEASPVASQGGQNAGTEQQNTKSAKTDEASPVASQGGQNAGTEQKNTDATNNHDSLTYTVDSTGSSPIWKGSDGNDYTAEEMAKKMVDNPEKCRGTDGRTIKQNNREYTLVDAEGNIIITQSKDELISSLTHSLNKNPEGWVLEEDGE